MSDLERVPQARRQDVRTALKSAFGAPTVHALQPISGGVSGALICRFEAGGRPYLLRVEPERVALADRERGYACMTSAAEAGAAPPVRYADAASGVAIMDFVASQPLCEYPGGPGALARALGALVARVQATPPFADVGDYPRMIGEMLQRLDGPGRFAAHADGLARIQAALPWDHAALVSSHNDPNPRNLLFDGRRLWLVDWELAFRNDPLVDIAILTTELAATPEVEDALLEAAFNRPPDATVRARLHVIRLLTRLFYGGVVLESLTGVPDATPDIAADTPAAFRAAVADGRLPSGSAQVAHAFARMSLATFLREISEPGFEEALKRVAG